MSRSRKSSLTTFQPVGRYVAAVIVAAAVGGFASACNTVPPCETLPAPTPVELQVAGQPNTEVEKELAENVDCELRDGRWQREVER